MLINKAAVTDANAIAKVHVDSWQVAYANILDPQWLAEMSVANRTERWVRILNATESDTHVARIGEKIVGFVSLGKCRDAGAESTCGEVWAMYIAPENWRTGIGQQLMAYSIECLTNQGFDSVLLWVLCDNTRGVHFYESCGFNRIADSEKLIEAGGRQVKEVAYKRTKSDAQK
jgi:ribosomal protein S18 acetylase RimI-like enzyme